MPMFLAKETLQALVVRLRYVPEKVGLDQEGLKVIDL
jgi:hypothetical protein